MPKEYYRECEFCGRPIIMREMPNGQWLPFERGGEQHFCIESRGGNRYQPKTIMKPGALIATCFVAVLILMLVFSLRLDLRPEAIRGWSRSG
jgi:hypothetical protein